VAQKYPAVIFNFVGDGPLRKQAEELANKNECIHFLGHIVDPIRLSNIRRESSLFLNTSLHETASLTIMEAMASALPVVSSDIPSVRELLGDLGYYYSIDNPNYCVDLIVDLLLSTHVLTDNSMLLFERTNMLFSKERLIHELLDCYAVVSITNTF
jgi:glycosyltransferase involved in cell wall biosynthesis